MRSRAGCATREGEGEGAQGSTTARQALTPTLSRIAGEEEKGALDNSYGSAVFMLRQAQHDRFLHVILSTYPFALSVSKGERRLFP